MAILAILATLNLSYNKEMTYEYPTTWPPCPANLAILAPLASLPVAPRRSDRSTPAQRAKTS